MLAVPLFRKVIATCSIFFVALTSFAAPPSMDNDVKTTLVYFDAALANKSYGIYPRLLVIVRDGKRKEIFWLGDVRKAGDFYVGSLTTIPVQIRNAKLGQTISVKKKDILDWSYQDPVSRKIYGNYGACLELQALPVEEKLEQMDYWGLECKPSK
ncbi:DUF2314 domain-containing protein [Undibacterium pigrum]|uniref:Uncharacterized protein DUF2314 n=1 Tax=Undibacterium pigrum TaxID=401470 RepID=A0A318J8W4_9BURK|nr:DUF2314 domain-containing protein [Undibacterium pigrum]PXX44130.1 uncharacterized protein DUF2314 [Undibacterium pigrum]